jgi:two-component system osmolarity sensor histidine kinase EnvZ
MIRFRRTLFARVFLLMVLLIVLSLSSALAIFHHVQQEPRAKQIAQLVVAVVNLSRAAILSAAPEWHSALLAEMGDAEGLRISMAEVTDVITPLPKNLPDMQLMMKKVRANLGENTRFAIKRNGVDALWVSFYIGHEEFWIAVPSERIERSFSEALLIWGSLVLMLALLGAYFVAQQISAPLKQLVHAAQQLGQGTMPPVLPENGVQEIQVVSRAFNQMSADLAAHERERALVLAGISHDLRTPLTRVRLAAEMSNDQTLRTGLIADVEQMDEVIQQFLDYARLDENEARVTSNLTALADEVAKRYSNLTCTLSLDLQADINSSVRPLLLKRALNNLLDNAIKYGGGAISVQLKKIDEQVWISIADNGSGIPEAQRELAQRPFVRLQTARSDSTGAGLGLAIVARAVRLHGGELILSDNTPNGLRVTLILPG